ncbi:MAG: ComEC/Rec2 family competence protein [Fibrobacteria bacterium]
MGNGIRTELPASCRNAAAFLSGWRKSAVAGYRRQYGLHAALPIIWGCLDAYLIPFRFPFLAALGCLGMAWFLEGEGSKPGRRLAWQALLFLLWVLFLAIAHPEAGGALSPATEEETEEAIVMAGTVSGFPSLKRKLTFAFHSESGDYRVQALPPGFSVQPGQRLCGRFHRVQPSPPTNPGQFDYPAYLRSQGLIGVLEAESLRLERPPGPFDRLIIRMRSALENGLTRYAPAAQGPLLRAALLGDTDALDPGLVEDFKASGMLHILAISGQHVGVFALILLQLFALLRLPRKAAYVATGIALGLYVPICGGQISVLRAAIMFWSCLPAVLWERPASALNNLGWAAVLSLLCMPYQILSLGFQLSFAATFFLILYSRPMARLLKRMRVGNAMAAYFISTPAFSVVIYLGVYPVLAAAVHAAAPSSILGNLATVGISSGMLVSACLALICHPVAPLASSFGECAGGLAALLRC